MFLNFSMAPRRIAVYVGLTIAGLSVLALLFTLIDKVWINPRVTVGAPTVWRITLPSGIPFILLGVVGEYLRLLYAEHPGTPQYDVHYIVNSDADRRLGVPTAKIKAATPEERNVS
jgi:hypothetical protein